MKRFKLKSKYLSKDILLHKNWAVFVGLVTSGLLLQTQAVYANMNVANRCSILLNEALMQKLEVKRTTQEAWDQSVYALKQINQNVYNRQAYVEALVSVALAKEFMWLNGDSGAAKTFLSRLFFNAILKSIPESDKKIFIIQFHKLITDQKIKGFQKFTEMMNKGQFHFDLSDTMASNRVLFIIADEAESANSTTLNALNSLLNERKIFHGNQVYEAMLSSGIFTSNKSTGQMVKDSLMDRESIEALLDRLAVKAHMLNQQFTPNETVELRRQIKAAHLEEIVLPLLDLQPLIAQVKIPDDLMAEIVSLSREIEQHIVKKTNSSREDFLSNKVEYEEIPANQFSTRSYVKLPKMFQSMLITKQLMQGVPLSQLRLKATRKDLALLAPLIMYIGPQGMDFKKIPLIDPAQIEKEGIAIVYAERTKVQMQVMYDPYQDQISVVNPKGQTIMVYARQNNSHMSGGHSWVKISTPPQFADWHIFDDGYHNEFKRIDSLIQSALKRHPVDVNAPQFETLHDMSGFMLKGTLKPGIEHEVNSINADLNQFVDKINQHFQKTSTPAAPTLRKLAPLKTRKEIRDFRREMRNSGQMDRIQKAFDWMSYEIKTLKQRYFEMDHVVEAIMTALLSRHHLYLFGPPGGAKTEIAESIIKAELQSMNEKEVDQFVHAIINTTNPNDPFLRSVLKRLRADLGPQKYQRFIIQFNKLTPEGQLIGSPAVNQQLEGKEKIDYSTSLANQKFVFAILDEVNNANPQTLTALLSTLAERAVFDGKVTQTGLRTAVLTSNKMISELLEAFEQDRAKGEAVLSRAVNLVYVSNKIASEEVLTQLLIYKHRGYSTTWNGVMALHELEPLLKIVDFENPVIENILAEVREKYAMDRRKVEKDTKKLFDTQKQLYPDYYVSAVGSYSDKNFNELVEQFKARFIIRQLIDGVEFKDVRTKIELKDLSLFFEGMGYWAPQQIKVSTDRDGLLQFASESHIMDKLTESGLLSSRVMYHQKKMQEESVVYAKIINDVVPQFQSQYRELVAQYPNLFKALNDSNFEDTYNELSSILLRLDVAQAMGDHSLPMIAIKYEVDKKYKELERYYTEKQSSGGF